MGNSDMSRSVSACLIQGYGRQYSDARRARGPRWRRSHPRAGRGGTTGCRSRAINRIRTHRHVDMNAVTPPFFESAGIPIVLGRDFQDSDALAVLPDRPAQPPPPGTEVPGVPGPPRVAIVNEAFVRKFLAGRSAIGTRVSMSEKWRDDRTHEIVGVVSDARYFDLRRAVEPMIYQPAYRERGANASLLTVRTTDDSNRLIDRRLSGGPARAGGDGRARARGVRDGAQRAPSRGLAGRRLTATPRAGSRLGRRGGR